MKRQKAHRLRIAILSAFVIGVLVFLANEELTGNPNAGIGKTFEIPTLAFAGATSTNINPSITCNVKHTATGIDSTGAIISSTNSQLASGNPLLDLTSGGKSMSGYVVELKMWCGNDSGATLIVPANSFNMVHYANDKNGSPVKVAQKTFSTARTVFEQGDSEKVIGYSSVYANAVEGKIDDGISTFNSLQTFQTYGTLQVHWDGYSGVQYDIPVPVNTQKSYITARIVNDNTQDPELADDDNDGIINKYDNCDTQAENYNGYQDSDGCPDAKPNDTGSGSDDNEPTSCPSGEELITSTNPNTCEVTQNSCNSIGKTWYKSTETVSGGVCSVKQTDSSGGMCDVWITNDNKCLGDTEPTNQEVSGILFWQIDGIKSDGGSFALTAKDDPNPFEFAIPLDVTGVDANNVRHNIQSIKFTPTLLMNDPAIHKLTHTDSVTAKFAVTALVDLDQDVRVTVKDNQSLAGFAKTSGASRENGIPLGSFVVTTSDIENAISKEVVKDGTSSKFNLEIKPKGATENNYVDLIINGKETRLSLGSGTTGTDTDTNLVWKELILDRGGGSNTKSPQEQCEVKTTGDDVFQWIDNECKNVSSIDNKEQCEANNRVWDEENGVCLDGHPPNPAPNGGMCVLDGTFPNDTNGDGVICGFCIDSDTTNNFPCHQPYRDDYCGGSTASPAECGDIPKMCDDLFLDPTDTCTPPVGQQCPDGYATYVNGDDLQCNPERNGGDDSDDSDSCPDTPLASLASPNVCIGNDDNDGDIEVNDTTCQVINGIVASCDGGQNPITQNNNLLLVGGLIAVVGISALVVKRMRN